MSIRVVFLAPNQAYGLLFGDSLVSVDNQYLWPSRQELVSTLGNKGLEVQRNGTVELKDAEPPETRH